MSRAGAAERGFTLIELLVVVAVLAVSLAIAMPYLRLGRPESLDKVARVVAARIKEERSTALRTGRIIRIETPRLAATLPPGFDLSSAAGDDGSLYFFPTGASTGARLRLATAAGTAMIEVDRLTGEIRVRQ